MTQNTRLIINLGFIIPMTIQLIPVLLPMCLYVFRIGNVMEIKLFSVPRANDKMDVITIKKTLYA